MSDLISRCELFNRLATIPAPPEANDLKAEIYKVIQSMETVEPKRGEWIEMGENEDGTHNIKCSYCNMFSKSKGHARSYYTKHIMKYCNHCGAKMEVEQCVKK